MRVFDERSHKIACYIALIALAITLVAARSAYAAPLAPIITPSGGYFKGYSESSINCFTPNVTIYYTTDGTTPTTSSPVYTEGTVLSFTHSATVKAFANDGSSSSGIATASYTIGTLATAAAPVISPDGSATTGSATVMLSCPTPGSAIYYTTDGSVPSTSSMLYTGAFSVSGSPVSVRAIAVASGYANSPIKSAVFSTGLVSSAVAPAISPNGGSFTGWKSVSLSTTTSNAVIRYTLDGSTPTSKSTAYLAPFLVCTYTLVTAKTFAAGLADSAPTAATFTADTTSPTVFDVSASGVLPSNPDNTAALQALLTSVQNLNHPSNPRRVKVVFPAGVYNFAGGLTLGNANNIDIDGQGSTWLFSNNGTATCFALGLGAPCANITIENLIVDQVTPPDVPGFVTASATIAGKNQIDFLIDTGIPWTSGEVINQGVLQYDPVQKLPWIGAFFDDYTGSNVTPTILGSRKIRMTLPRSSVANGTYLNFRRLGLNHTFKIQNVTGLNISNVRLYSGYNFGIAGSWNENISISNLAVVRSPTSVSMTTNEADATHWFNNKGTLTYTDCDIENQGDDMVNVHGSYYTVTAQSGNTVTIINSLSTTQSPNVSVGELVEFRSGSTLVPSTPMVVTAVAKSGTAPAITTMTFASAPPALTLNTDVCDSLTWLPSTVNYARCTFVGGRAHGIKIQTPNTTIKNCRFFNVSAMAVDISTAVSTWQESTGVSNANVLNNSMENCNYLYPTSAYGGTIAVFANNNTNHPGSSSVLGQIAIADNTIVNTDYPGMTFNSANDVDVINNTLTNVSNASGAQPNNAYSIYLSNAANVRFTGNAQTTGNYLKSTPVAWMPAAPTGGYNSQPFLIGFSQTSAHNVKWSYSWNCQDALPTGETPFVSICNSAGTVVYSPGTGGMGDPATWDNGSRIVSAAVSSDLTTVADGTYTVRMGLANSGGTRLKLVGSDDGTQRIIVGTLVISGSGSAITFTSTQLDIRPRINMFKQTGSRTFQMSTSWENHDNAPAGYSTVANICDATGTSLFSFSTGSTTDPSTWTLGKTILSGNVFITLPGIGTLPDASTYTIRLGLVNAASALLPLFGNTDSSSRIIDASFSSLTGASKTIGWDAGTTSGITLTGNTGF